MRVRKDVDVAEAGEQTRHPIEAAALDRGKFETREGGDALKTLARQGRAKAGRDGDPPLLVDPIHEGVDEQGHRSQIRALRRAPRMAGAAIGKAEWPEPPARRSWEIL